MSRTLNNNNQQKMQKIFKAMPSSISHFKRFPSRKTNKKLLYNKTMKHIVKDKKHK